MNDEIRIRTRPDDFDRFIMMVVYKMDSPGKVSVMKTDQYQETPGAVYADSLPYIRIERDEAQNLMDQLWRWGLRPTEGQGSAGAMAAAQAHLKDLQDTNNRLLKLVEADRQRPVIIIRKHEEIPGNER